jgi:hypothetical protein
LAVINKKVGRAYPGSGCDIRRVGGEE